MNFPVSLIFGLIAVFVLAPPAVAQADVPRAAPGKPTLFRDSNGSLISNNEFVDIRMANYNYPDATQVKRLEDGTVEFRLQKVPQEGMRAPRFSVKTLDGRTLSLEGLKGKVVVVNFWFVGCPACLDMEPKLNAFKARFAADDGEIVFVAITADAAGVVRKYQEKHPFDYVQATDAGDAIKSFAFSSYPKNIVISRRGEIVYWRSGVKAWDKFESVIRAELGRPR